MGYCEAEKDLGVLVKPCFNCPTTVCLLIVGAILPGCSDSGTVNPQRASTSILSSISRGPYAEFEQLTVNLGAIEISSIDTTAIAKIRVKNVGDTPLTIRQITVSCGCTRVSPPDGPIAPGEAVEIEVAVTISRAGKASAGITVHSDSIERPITVVRILWDAIAPIMVMPEEILLGNVRAGEIKTGRANLVLSRFQSCPLTNVTLDNSATGNSSVSIRLDDAGVLYVSVHASDPPGEYLEYAVLKLIGCWRDSIRVPVRWKVIAKHALTPENIYVGKVRPGESITQVIFISGPEDEPLKAVNIRSIQPSETIAQSEWKAINRRSGTLAITMVAPQTVGAFHTELQLQVSESELEALKVEVSGYVTEQGF